MKVMKTSSLTVVVATLGPGGSNSEFPNFFQFCIKARQICKFSKLEKLMDNIHMYTKPAYLSPSDSLGGFPCLNFESSDNLKCKDKSVKAGKK